MADLGWDVLLLTQPSNVNWLERVLVPAAHPVLLWIEPEGAPLLVTDGPGAPAQAERAPFES
jgi:hypothetical protein